MRMALCVMLQTTKIEKTDDGKVVLNTQYGTKSMRVDFGPSKGYDIFLAHYLDKAAALPADIKRLFWGT